MNNRSRSFQKLCLKKQTATIDITSPIHNTVIIFDRDRIQFSIDVIKSF